jgi:hypothetical protein
LELKVTFAVGQKRKRKKDRGRGRKGGREGRKEEPASNTNAFKISVLI